MALEVGTNSWVTEAEGDTYMALRAGATAWSTADKDGLLVTAYWDLNDCGLFSFPVTATDAMKRAQFEQALARLLDPDMDSRAVLRAQGVTEAGIIKEKYAATTTGVPIAPRAYNILRAEGLLGDSAKPGKVFTWQLERDDTVDAGASL